MGLVAVLDVTRSRGSLRSPVFSNFSGPDLVRLWRSIPPGCSTEEEIITGGV